MSPLIQNPWWLRLTPLCFVPIFNSLRNGNAVFLSSCTVLHSSQWCTRILISPRSHQHLLSSILFHFDFRTTIRNGRPISTFYVYLLITPLSCGLYQGPSTSPPSLGPIRNQGAAVWAGKATGAHTEQESLHLGLTGIRQQTDGSTSWSVPESSNHPKFKWLCVCVCGGSHPHSPSCRQGSLY